VGNVVFNVPCMHEYSRGIVAEVYPSAFEALVDVLFHGITTTFRRRVRLGGYL